MSEKNNTYESMLDAPHLLVVGATGSGKSVLINALIYNIIKEGPEKNQLILVDPKRVELHPYKTLPHSMIYACEPDTMLESLNFAIKIMEQRYEEMQSKGLKNTDEYSIYVIIDEYADLIDVCKKPAENAIIRLAQLGRAAGIHIIAATQNCTTKVVNTRIKSNFPARVVLKTAFMHESINVVGKRGAEDLPKYGKGYFLSGNDCNLVDIDMISDEKINTLIKSYEGIKNPYKESTEDVKVSRKTLNNIIQSFGNKRLISIRSLSDEFGLSKIEAERYADELVKKGYLKRSMNSERLSVIQKKK